MAIVVATLDAWGSAGPAGAIYEHTHLVLAQVFQKLEGGNFAPGFYTTEGVRTK
jgi:hypothetical protein